MSWHSGRLGDVLTLKRGHDLPDSQRQDGDVPVVSSSGITGRHSEAKAKAPGVVTGRYGTLGEVFYVEEDYWPLNTALYVTDFKGNQPRFVAYFLQNVLRDYQSDKAAVPGVNRNVLHELKVRYPDANLQKRVVGILSAYDDLIENNRQRIVLLEETARQLYREWFVRLRFPGHEHSHSTNGVPEGWETRGMLDHPLFEFIDENIGRYDGLKRYYATADIDGIHVAGEGIEYSFEEKPSRAQKAPEVGSVWFARMQNTYKVLVFTSVNVSLAGRSMLSSGFAGFRSRAPDFLPFLYLTVNSSGFHDEKDRFCTGATQRSLTNKGLRSICVASPPPHLVAAFSTTTTPLIDQILTLQTENAALAAARDLLLPRLMTGEISV